MDECVFLDAAYAIALASRGDRYHERALALATDLESRNVRLVTTRPVLLEIGNALSRQKYRAAAVQLLRSLLADPSVEVVSLDDDLFSRALDLYQARADKDWGLTDCISFVIMKDRRIVFALTPDEHFQQAGFVAGMRDSSER